MAECAARIGNPAGGGLVISLAAGLAALPLSIAHTTAHPPPLARSAALALLL